MKKIVFRLVLLAIVAAAGWAGYRWFQQMPQRQVQIPTTKVKKGDVVVRSYTRGELRAVRSATLTAPNLFGTVQVTRLAPLGAFAREKDLVVEFDDSEVLSRLEEKELELEQIDEQIKKAKADLAMRNNQDQVDLLRARYAVRRAELEVKRNELISQIDAKKNVLNLEEARRRLQQLEVNIKGQLEQAEAELAVLQERRNRAVLELNREKQRLSQVKLLAPISGLVSVRQNSSGFRMFGMQSPDIREGDQVQPGMPVADVLDLSELEISAKVGELDRANLHEGQEALITLDAIPEKRFRGRIKNLSGTATANVFSSDPGKKFDVNFSVDMAELMAALGANQDQIKKVLATAEANRKKAPASSLSSQMLAAFGMRGGPGGGPGMAGGGGGFPGGGFPAGGAFGGEGGQREAVRAPGGGEGGEGAGAEGGQRRRPGGAGGPGGGGLMGGGNLSEEDRAKMRQAFEKALGGKSMQDLSPEERQKVMAKLREQFPQMGGRRPEGSKDSKDSKDANAGERPARAGGARRGGEGDATGEGGQRAERRGGAGDDGAPGLPVMGFSAGPRFTEKDFAAAKLPPPPEEDDQLDVLLRPGLLADLEIIVEKLPDVIHIPTQAVFEKDGKLVAYVKTAKGFEERIIKPLKRSESIMVVASGLSAGETVALADPNVKPGDKKKTAGPGAAGNGGGGGGGGGMGLPGGKK